MNEIQKIKSVIAREELDRGDIVHTAGAPSTDALIPGWDYVADLGAPDPVGFGIWRTPHQPLGDDVALGVNAPLQMLHTGLDRDKLYARHWRLARMFGDHRSERQAELAKKGDWLCRKDYFAPIQSKYEIEINRQASKREPRQFAPIEDETVRALRETKRDLIIRSVLGHSILDAVDFLIDLQKKDERLAYLLLAKRFTEALEKCPGVADLPWPDECHKRWERKAGGDFLPPFYHLVHLAEFQRLAQNSAALMALSFEPDGEELTIAYLKELVKNTAEMDPERVVGTLSENLRAMLGMAVFQTCALLPTPAHYKAGNQATTRAHSQNVSDLLRTGFAAHGMKFADMLTGPCSGEAGALVLRTLHDHHDRFPDIPNHSKSERMRGRHSGASTYWGWAWLDHSIIGLFEIAESVQRFNEDLGKVKLSKDRRKNGRQGREIGLGSGPIKGIPMGTII